MGRSECGGKGGGEECYAGEAQADGVLHGASEHGFGVGRLREHEAEKAAGAEGKHQEIQHGYCAFSMRRAMRKNIAANVRKHSSTVQ